MIFATVTCDSSRDGRLLLVHPSRKLFLDISSQFRSLRETLENWDECVTDLMKLDQWFRSRSASEKSGGVRECVLYGEEELRQKGWKFRSVLPRTFLFADGSSYLDHVRLVRQARKAPLPKDLLTDPLVYQAEGGIFYDNGVEVPSFRPEDQLDFEGELGVIVDDVPMGVSVEKALQHIKLVVLINDFSLRGLIPSELEKGFGFFQSKPPKALSPFALTLDEFQDHYTCGRFHLHFKVWWNQKCFANLDTSVMHFHFGELIAHIARTRPLVAGSLIGSGTVSNPPEWGRGHSCIVEKRMCEIIQEGKPHTDFLKPGDSIGLEACFSDSELSLFGPMTHFIAPYRVD